MKTFEQYIKEHLDVDPFGEENWDDDDNNITIPNGYYKIRMVEYTEITISYGEYIEDVYSEKYQGYWELMPNEELYIDIIDQDDNNVYFTSDDGGDYVANGHMPKKSFIII